MSFSVRGPKGHLVVRNISVKELAKKLPALVKEHHKVTVAPAVPVPAKAKKQAPAKANANAHPGSTAKIRAGIVAFCEWGIAHEGEIHYAMQRPMERLRTPAELKELPRDADCSEWATDSYAFAGGPDPNGQDFSGTGNTGTMLEHCRPVNKQDAQPGDLAVFGVYPGHHVVVLLEDGTANAGNPLVCSHGQEKGPLAIHLNTEALAQPVPITFLTCL